MPSMMDQFTTKATEALSAAQMLAQTRGHAELTPLHLLVAMLSEEGTPGRLIERVGADPSRVRQVAEAELNRQPTVSGAGNVTMSREMGELLGRARKEADGLQDKYVSTEHLLV